MSQTLLEMAKDLVMAQIEAHRLSPEEMHQALQQTYASLQALQAQEDANGSVAVVTPETPPEPVNWKKSITKHTVTCLECGASLQATVGETSQGTWVGWAVVSGKVPYTEDTAISRQRDHVETEGDRAESQDRGRRLRRS